MNLQSTPSQALRAGLLGDPVEHSLSPLLHPRAARELGLELSYSAIRTPRGETRGTIETARQLGYIGLNVTAPVKLEALRCMDSLAPEAVFIGAVNTICFGTAGASGHNTDSAGFAWLLGQQGFDAPGCTALVLGAGGAARAVVHALAGLGAARVQVLARSAGALSELPALPPDCMTDLEGLEMDSSEAERALAGAALVVNATGAGMPGREQESPLYGFPELRSDALAVDLAYRPRVTRFMAQAGNVGARTVNGMAMFAAQAAYSLALWTGRDVEPQLMLRCLAEAGYGD